MKEIIRIDYGDKRYSIELDHYLGGHYKNFIKEAFLDALNFIHSDHEAMAKQNRELLIKMNKIKALLPMEYWYLLEDK